MYKESFKILKYIKGTYFFPGRTETHWPHWNSFGHYLCVTKVLNSPTPLNSNRRELAFVGLPFSSCVSARDSSSWPWKRGAQSPPKSKQIPNTLEIISHFSIVRSGNLRWFALSSVNSQSHHHDDCSLWAINQTEIRMGKTNNYRENKLEWYAICILGLDERREPMRLHQSRSRGIKGSPVHRFPPPSGFDCYFDWFFSWWLFTLAIVIVSLSGIASSSYA